MPRLPLICALLLASTLPAVAQSFVNLNFESATVAPTPVGGFGMSPVDPAQAFPGWTAGIAGTSSAPTNWYNNTTLGTPAQVLIGPAFPNALGISALSGSYSVILEYSSPTAGTGALSQTGLVPVGTRSINFLLVTPGTLLVSLGGSPLPLFDLGGGRYGADATAFAGQVVPLVFQAANTLGPVAHFDDVVFSNQPVPEPSTLAFAAALGGAGLWISRRRQISG